MAQIAEEKQIITVNTENENHSQARFASLDKKSQNPWKSRMYQNKLTKFKKLLKKHAKKYLKLLSSMIK